MSTRRKRNGGDPRKNAFQGYQAAYKCGHCTGRLTTGPKGWGVYHDPGCPAYAGIVDVNAAGRRAAAAASEQTGMAVAHGSWFDGAAEAIADVLPGGPVGPRAAAVIELCLENFGRLDECPHLKAEGPAFMIACKPETILCTACWIAAGQRITGTREDATCDYCQAWQPMPAEGNTRMYGTWTEPFPKVMFQTHFGLCPACWEADHAAMAA